MLPEKITFRPGTLAGPMAKKLAASGEGPSQYVRRLIAADCGIDAPEMPQGFAAMSEKKANRARKSSAKTRKQRSEG